MAEYKYVDWPGLQYYHSKVTDLIDSRLHDCIRFGGEAIFEKLESPDTPDLNIIYRILNSFTVLPSNEWFDESTWNKTYPAGTLLQVVQLQQGVVYTVFMQPSTVAGGSGSEIDLSNYYTIAEVDAKIIDALKPYATVEFVISKLDAIQSLIDAHVDNFGKLTARVVDVENALTKKVDIDQFESAINDLTQTKADVTDIPSLDGYATETFVVTKIAEAQLSEGEVDISAFYTREEIDSKGFVTEDYVQQQLEEADVVGMDTRLTEMENQSTLNSQKLAEIEDQAIANAATLTALDGEIDRVSNTILDMDNQLTSISQNIADLQLYGTF